MKSSRTNLYAASRQWADRPADQRFWNLSDMTEATRKYAEESVVKEVVLAQCQAQAVGDDLVLAGPNGHPAEFQHYSFGQIAGLCKAPASYLRELPAKLAADNLNHGLSKLTDSQALMFHKNGGLHLRCVTGRGYQRIWNYEIAQLAWALEQEGGWRVPPARPCGLPNIPTRVAAEGDVLRNASHKSLGIKVGDTISPAGLYASDHDCFIFQVNENRPIDAGNGEGLYRGVFWSNSEVGDSKFRATFFLFDSVCGNHIVWSAKVLGEISIRHTGNARGQFKQAMAWVDDRMEVSAAEDEQRIHAAKQFRLGPGRSQIVEMVFRKNFGLSKQECENAWVLAERHEDDHGGDPTSAWGYAAGVTRLSQQQYADKRDAMDRAAGKILDLAF